MSKIKKWDYPLIVQEIDEPDYFMLATSDDINEHMFKGVMLTKYEIGESFEQAGKEFFKPVNAKIINGKITL